MPLKEQQQNLEGPNSAAKVSEQARTADKSVAFETEELLDLTVPAAENRQRISFNQRKKIILFLINTIANVAIMPLIALWTQNTILMASIAFILAASITKICFKLGLMNTDSPKHTMIGLAMLFSGGSLSIAYLAPNILTSSIAIYGATAIWGIISLVVLSIPVKLICFQHQRRQHAHDPNQAHFTESPNTTPPNPPAPQSPPRGSRHGEATDLEVHEGSNP